MEDDGKAGRLEGLGEMSEGVEAKTRGKRIRNRVRKPGFLTLWHEMLRRDGVMLRKKGELIKMMRKGRERMERGECRWGGERNAGPTDGRGGWLRKLRER